MKPSYYYHVYLKGFNYSCVGKCLDVFKEDGRVLYEILFFDISVNPNPEIRDSSYYELLYEAKTLEEIQGYCLINDIPIDTSTENMFMLPYTREITDNT